MKTLAYLMCILLLSSCAFNQSSLKNNFHNTTRVELSQKNCRIVGQAVGSAQANYIYVIGIPTKKVIENAKRKMIKNAELDGTSKALANMNVDVVHSSPLGIISVAFFFQKKVFVSADIVEFTN